MSIRVMTRVWEHATYKEGALLTLLALADYADDNGVCWPGQPELSHKARLGERQLRNVLHMLEGKGEIVSVPGRGRGNVTVYCVLSGLDGETREARCDWFLSHYGKAAIDDTKPAKKAAKTAAFTNEKRQLATIKAAIDDTEKRQLTTDKSGNRRHEEKRQFSAPERAETPVLPVMQPSCDPSVDPSWIPGGGGGRDHTTHEPPPPPPRHFALQAFAERYPSMQLSVDQERRITTTVTDAPTWEMALNYWTDNRHKPANLTGLLDKYTKELRYAAERNGQLETNQPGRHASAGPQPTGRNGQRRIDPGSIPLSDNERRLLAEVNREAGIMP